MIGMALLALQATTAQPARVAALKQEAMTDVASRAQFTQQMVDQIFSYGELGFQETETSRYLVTLLRKNGFTVREGVAGFRPPGWRRGDPESRSSPSAPTSTTSRRRRRSPAWPVTHR
jgi:aminobenzoyl-glutamate utilization protein B